ncbi:hypothetical protein CAOG_00898 [Capsaspora owczarzaki ATCC 30864]|nr:hypothetical protein CAOG_00898 [Capsaspora owczarzaki ATCC 30864]|eukprot:XP_004365769.1 hypothetical protein CAOG_00898 [Capsaspora owczarzaki ATCC 30864]
MSSVSPLIRASRYVALGLGLLYGASQARAFQARADAHRAIAADEARKHPKPVAGSSTGVVTDPNAPGFSLGAYLKYLDETSGAKAKH